MARWPEAALSPEARQALEVSGRRRGDEGRITGGGDITAYFSETGADGQTVDGRTGEACCPLGAGSPCWPSIPWRRAFGRSSILSGVPGGGKRAPLELVFILLALSKPLGCPMIDDLPFFCALMS
jgi:hypothetical protein